MINPNLGGNRQGLHYGKRNQKGREKQCYFLKSFFFFWGGGGGGGG